MRLAVSITLILCALIGTFLGLGGFTFYYAEGGSYLSDDSRTCVNCHVMREQYEGWQHGSHHAVATCNDCHTPHDFVGHWLTKASNGYHHSRAFTFQDFHEPIQIRQVNLDVLNANCVYCHGELTSDIRLIGYGAENQHGDEGVEMDCVRCHRSVGHGPTE
jgi:cytochrome c nitrite reductase small subunit